MTGTKPQLDNKECADFQERLPEIFESHADLSAEEHLKTCENCSALVRDLEYIAQQAKLLLPIHDPSPAVWNKIEDAIQREPAAPASPAAKPSTV
jgi:hypothetical protein